MNFKLIIAACAVGLIVTQLVIHEFKRDPTEYTELNFVFVKRAGEHNERYTIYFDTPVETTERVFRYNCEYYTLLEYNDEMVLLAKYPKKIAVNESFTFSFEITNQLDNEWSYTYYISIDEEPVKDGMVTLCDGESTLVTAELQIDSPGERKVSVQLSTGEEIYFYVDVI
jgi:hypothetical protein